MFACNVFKEKNVYKKSLEQRVAATVFMCPVKIPQHQMAKHSVSVRAYDLLYVSNIQSGKEALCKNTRHKCLAKTCSHYQFTVH